MSEISVAIVGTGPHPERDDSGDGSSMGYRHARAYRSLEGCSLVGCADVVADHARDFADEFDLPRGHAVADYRDLLAELEPDLVGVCTPPATHPDIVGDCAASDAVRAIHCEKPMAVTMGESRRMVEECEDRGVQLTINLQTRCSDATRLARRLIDDGEIGDLRRVEASRRDLLQTGIHNIGLANYLNGDRDVEWVLGQVDARSERVWYTDMYSEDEAIGHWRYDNGVHGLARTGDDFGLLERSNRVVGTDGVIELDPRLDPPLQVVRDGEREEFEADTGSAQRNALADVIEALERDEPSVVDASAALAATEIVFGVWESARRRGRVDLPLRVDGNPLAALIESES